MPAYSRFKPTVRKGVEITPAFFAPAFVMTTAVIGLLLSLQIPPAGSSTGAGTSVSNESLFPAVSDNIENRVSRTISGQGLSVRGRQLHSFEQLRYFYARRSYLPAWSGRLDCLDA